MIMGFFAKTPQKKIKLIVGLGNYPDEYKMTKHNAGFLAIDAIQRSGDFDEWFDNKKLKCKICRGFFHNQECILIKPQTYMNLSGESVIAVVKFYKIRPEDIIVIHDELDLKFGQIKLTQSRNPAGHNGIKSINSHVHEPYHRVRIGIDRPPNRQYDVAAYVLSKFTHDEQQKLDDILEEVSEIVKNLLC